MTGAVSVRDELQRLRRSARAVTVVAVLLAALLGLALYLDRSDKTEAKNKPVQEPCRPVALAVVPGDTEAGDVAYVLDSCGSTRRQPAGKRLVSIDSERGYVWEDYWPRAAR